MGRLLMHCISGVIFYTTYVGDFVGNVNAIWAGILYNMSYIIPEVILTLALLALPPVRTAFSELKKMALN